MSTTPQQWAAWFRESADQADDLTEGQREGFRIARVATIVVDEVSA